MENIAVIFGGKSVEHDISVITALQVMKSLSKKYNLVPLYLRSDGVMVTADNLADSSVYLDYAKNVKKEKLVSFKTGCPQIYIESKNKIKNIIKIDCAILCNHGHGGEDGSLQGLLELCEIPYTSPSVSTSAICMDKVLTKMVFTENDLLTPAYVYFNKCEYKENEVNILQKIEAAVSFPCIVKPARCGSSVGISICECKEKLTEVVDKAFLYDDKVIVEEFINDSREFFCGVINISGQKITSKIDETSKDKFFTFEEKYLKNKKQTQVKLSKKLTEKIKAMAVKAYSVLECDGVVRIDFLMSQDEVIYVNEVNTIPGSLAFNLFDSNFSDFLNVLIKQAKERLKKAKEIVYEFNSSAIKKYIELGQIEKVGK